MAIADHFEMYVADAMAETLQGDPAAFWTLARRIAPLAALSRLTAGTLAVPAGRAVLQLMASVPLLVFAPGPQLRASPCAIA